MSRLLYFTLVVLYERVLTIKYFGLEEVEMFHFTMW